MLHVESLHKCRDTQSCLVGIRERNELRPMILISREWNGSSLPLGHAEEYHDILLVGSMELMKS